MILGRPCSTHVYFKYMYIATKHTDTLTHKQTCTPTVPVTSLHVQSIVNKLKRILSLCVHLLVRS